MPDKFFDQFEDDKSFFNNFQNEPPPVTGDNYKGPDTFWGGVKDSINKYEPMKANLEGLKGYVKGALLDLPSSIIGGIKNIGNAMTNPSAASFNTGNALMNAPKDIMNTTMRAGSEPENFGRMMGQMTGQPLATEGLVKAAPYAPQAAINTARVMGKPLEAMGETMARYQPLSGFLPRFADMRSLRTMERIGGRGIRNIGEKLQGLETPDMLKPDYIKSLPSKFSSMLSETKKGIPVVNRPYEAADYAMDNAYTKARGGIVDPQLEALAKPTGKPRIIMDANGKFIDKATGEEVGPLAYKNEYEPWKGARIIGDKLNEFLPESLTKFNFRGKR